MILILFLILSGPLDATHRLTLTVAPGSDRHRHGGTPGHFRCFFSRTPRHLGVSRRDGS